MCSHCGHHRDGSSLGEARGKGEGLKEGSGLSQRGTVQGDEADVLGSLHARLVGVAEG